MENRNFTKNDNAFICQHCGAKVEKLGVTSRDHCNKCLYSLHVDINPGDRANTCKGLMKPVSVEWNAKKNTYSIVYQCTKCGQMHKNKIADDDDRDEMFRITRENSYSINNKKWRK